MLREEGGTVYMSCIVRPAYCPPERANLKPNQDNNPIVIPEEASTSQQNNERSPQMYPDLPESVRRLAYIQK